MYGFDFRVGQSEVVTIEEVTTTLKKIAKRWTFQLERGAENGYMHFQGRLSLKVKKRANEVLRVFGDWKPNWIAPTVTKEHEEETDFYMLKDETRVDGPWRNSDEDLKHIFPQELVGKSPSPAQLKVLESASEYDANSINYWFDPQGGHGKGCVVDFMLQQNAGAYLMLQESPKDLMRQAYMIAGGSARRGFKMCIIDVPRTWSDKAFKDMFGIIEQLKDGWLMEDRYHSQRWKQAKPMIWVFSNRMPSYGWLSPRRWKVWMATDEEDISLQTLEQVSFADASKIYGENKTFN